MAELSFCLVSTFYPPDNFGGDGIHVQRLARGLAARGHRVRVVHNPTAFRMLARRRAAEPPPDDDGVEVVRLPAGRAATVGTYLTGRPTGYRSELEALAAGFDVVHFHNPSLLGGPGSFHIGDGIRAYTTHEHWLMCPTHVLFRYDREVCTTRTCVRCTLAHRRPPQLWRTTGAMSKAVRQLDILFCQSRFTAELHRAEFPDVRIEVLPLPAPPAADAAAPPVDLPRPYFVYAGRLEPIKGVDRLVAAFGQVRGADLVVAGDGELRGRLEELAAGSSAIRFVGRITPEEVLGLCRKALAVVVPSAGYETFGGVAVEAMGVGTPAVVRDLGPLPELVEGGAGLTFADDHDLVVTLQRLVDEPGLAAALGDRAAQVAAGRYSESGFFEGYLAGLHRAASDAGRADIAARLAAAREALPT